METSENENKEIHLHVDGKVFMIAKNLLCEYSEYFRAMFSGYYVETDKKDIQVEVLNQNSMEILMKYMNIGLIDLSDYPLHVISKLATASNYLQMTELIKQIKYWLDLQLSFSNWIEIMSIAQEAAYIDLYKVSVVYGLLSFKDMKPEYIPDVPKLFWYLSHPSLATESELNVFKFGCNWIQQLKVCPNSNIYLLLLGCLDISKLTLQDLIEISLLMKNCEDTLAANVVECLKMLADKLGLSVQVMIDNSALLLKTFTGRVFREVYRLIYFCKKRKLDYTPVVPIWLFKGGKMEYTTHHLYTFCKVTGLKLWLSVASKDMWGWNLASWGATNLVQVCGEFGRGTGQFMKDVRVYDTLRKQWTDHGVKLPVRRHAGVTVLGDSLFIIGGVGGFRVLQDTTIIYNLKERTHRRAANFPDAIQSPAICTHYGAVYAAGQKNIYVYKDSGEKDMWMPTLTTIITINHMISFKDYIYCSQNYFSNLYRFRPGIDEKLEQVTKFTTPPAAFCSYGDSLLVFTRSMLGEGEEMNVELYSGPFTYSAGECDSDSICQPLFLYSKKQIAVNDVAGAFSLVLNMPETENNITDYHKLHLKNFAHITGND